MMVPLAMLGVGFPEMLVVAVIALLLYGGDLPTVARQWGKTYNEFRRHLSQIRDELNATIYADPEPPRRLTLRPEAPSSAGEVVAVSTAAATVVEAPAEAPTAVEPPLHPAD